MIMVSELSDNVAEQRGNAQKRLGGCTGKGFMPGQSGNPAGRPSAGAAVREWWNQMQGWSTEQIQSVINDPSASVSKIAAAQQWLKAQEGNGTSVDRICDRTDGKPEQPLTLGAELLNELQNCNADELRRIRATIADASRRAGRAVTDAGVN